LPHPVCTPSTLPLLEFDESDKLSWVEYILRPTVNQSVCLGIGLPFGAHDQILSLSFLLWQLLCCSSCRVPSLTRGWVCNLQCNRWLVRSLRTNNHTLPYYQRLYSLFVVSYDSQGLWWRYSNPPPHGSKVKVKVKVTLRPTISLGVRRPFGTHDQFLSPWDFLLDSCGLLFCSTLSDERSGLSFVSISL
jgi:hypothetical protein